MSKSNAGPKGRALAPLIAADDDVRPQRFGARVRLQARKVGEETFDLKKKKVFIETLGRTANVTRSAKTAGVSVSTAYRHRSRYPFFHEAWFEALDRAYDVLETVMLERALRYNFSLSEGGIEPEEAGGSDGAGKVEIAPFSNGDAMRLLKLHRDTVVARRAQISARVQSRPEAARERLTEKLYAIHARLIAREKARNDAPA
jgi:hypothetical protein